MSSISTDRALVIGTRGSPLALAQANMVRDLLQDAHPGLEVGLSVIKTSGDRFLDQPLADIGGKGLFTKEIEEAMLAGSIDLAVHSMKDVPTELPAGLVIDCMLEREDPRDVLLTRLAGIKGLADLPPGARVGTASLRRKAQLLSLRPDMVVSSIRGNVGTRMKKLDEGVADATFLALAGLKRLGLGIEAGVILSEDEMLPAVAQGAIGIEWRSADDGLRALLDPLDHLETRIAVTAERALLAGLDGSCRTPIAAIARIDNAGNLYLKARVIAPDGGARFDWDQNGKVADAVEIGETAARELRSAAGSAFFEALAGL